MLFGMLIGLQLVLWRLRVEIGDLLAMTGPGGDDRWLSDHNRGKREVTCGNVLVV